MSTPNVSAAERAGRSFEWRSEGARAHLEQALSFFRSISVPRVALNEGHFKGVWDQALQFSKNAFGTDATDSALETITARTRATN